MSQYICIGCGEEIKEFELVSADVFEVTTNALTEYPHVVDVVFKCPHCTQEYNTFVSHWDLDPV